jgi:hypothetical protein
MFSMHSNIYFLINIPMKICDSDVVRVKGVFEDDAQEVVGVQTVVTSDGKRHSYFGKRSEDGKFFGGMLLKARGGYVQGHLFDDAEISRCTPDDHRRRDEEEFREMTSNVVLAISSIASFLVLAFFFSRFTLAMPLPGIVAYPLGGVMACVAMGALQIFVFFLGVLIFGF